MYPLTRQIQKNYSCKITHFMHNSLKTNPSFPEILRVQNPSKLSKMSRNYVRMNFVSESMNFVVLSLKPGMRIEGVVRSKDVR